MKSNKFFSHIMNIISFLKFILKHRVSIQLYEKISQEALENLADVFDQLLEEKFNKEYDVSLSVSYIAKLFSIFPPTNVFGLPSCQQNGVLTVQLENIGTYVINKQTPNRQLWLSSPSSGPKRFDYINHKWIYLHDFCTLDDILSNELSGILGEPVRIISN